MAFLWDCYDAWQRALAAEFFSPEHAGQAVVFHIDDGVAETIQEKHQLPESLTQAVKPHIDLSRRSHAFGTIRDRAQALGSGSQPPRSLPLLAVSVLAASRMSRDGEIQAINYFTPLKRLLYGEEADDNNRKRDTLDQSFGEVVDLWRQLDGWLRANKGAFGVSTITPDKFSNRARIGYPLSQALTRLADRQKLTQFFCDAEITPGKSYSGTYLLRMLDAWTNHGRKRFSRRFEAALAAREPVLASLIIRQAVSWDGKVLDSGGNGHLLRLRLAFDHKRARLFWAAHIAAGISGGTLTIGDTEIRFESDQSPYYEGIERLPLTPSSIAMPLRVYGHAAAGDPLVARYTPQEVIPFRQDPHLGSWVSQDSLEAHEEHLLLVSPEQQAEVRQVLQVAAPGFIAVPPPMFAAVLPNGWRLYRNVCFEDPAALSRVSRQHAETAARLRPNPIGRPKLVGGLPVLEELGSHHYLQGGAPDLLLPAAGDGSRRVSVSLGDGTQRTDFRATGYPIPLPQDMLRTGRHEISADGAVLSLTIHERVVDSGLPPGTGAFGLIAEEIDNPGVTPPVILARRNATETAFVSYEGVVWDAIIPNTPQWLRRRQILENDPLYFEIKLEPQDRGWLIERTARRVTAIPGWPTWPKEDVIMGAEARADWAELILNVTSPPRHALWPVYVKIARKILNDHSR
ncbi:hypothetical protein ACU635_08730 [[Actinomadura] parvosata]|uniref:hypothetical protein n=1 Tax=[Actinomadura] parvosata TaxID=1955412 RepID=UPI00406C28F2